MAARTVLTEKLVAREHTDASVGLEVRALDILHVFDALDPKLLLDFRAREKFPSHELRVKFPVPDERSLDRFEDLPEPGKVRSWMR